MNSALRLVTVLVFCLILHPWSGHPLVPRPALAGPPAPVVFTLAQPDGLTSFEVRVWGDESASGLETTAGYTVVKDQQTGYWVYAVLDALTGRLVPTGCVAGRDAPPASAYGARPVRLSRQAQAPARGPARVAAVSVLVLMVQYTSQPGRTSQADWTAAFFGPGGSANHYYREISYHKFSLTPAVESCGGTANDGLTGWLTLGVTHPNSGGPSIARAALNAADSCVNYALFDTNGDGDITSNELLVVIIVAGYETSYGGPVALTPGVWGHQGVVQYKSLTDGVTILPYAQFGEWHAADWDRPGHRATIGLMVHEIGHLLGWPDLYDTSPPGNPDSEGVGEWSLMGSGLWLGAPYPGDTPAHPSAWEKWYQGWLEPLQLRQTWVNVNLPQVEDQPLNSVIQLLDNPNGVDWSFEATSGLGEYFLVENRQQVGYDTRLPGCGLLIWHIDESVVSSNWANADKNHRLVDLEEADGLDQLDRTGNRGDSGDPYPGSSNNTGFSALSRPDSRLYNGRSTALVVTGISPGCARVKTATFMVPVIAPHFRLALTSTPAVIEDTTLQIGYTITLSNDGNGEATGVVLTDILPALLNYLPGSASGGDETAPGSGILAWPPVTLPVGATISRTFQTIPRQALVNGSRLTHLLSVTSNQAVGINNLALSHIVGNRPVYLPIIQK